ncbi:hypothetical protein CK203_071064 [Vitis vinifera]|uniref:DUF4283 domain-containing protein n=1 Tax=Vitis vinifera TaxID=29760 RepID=A0A438E934_VITVI|nr:hypothetical protein CK203_071064 [Vitis vinifera]
MGPHGDCKCNATMGMMKCKVEKFEVEKKSFQVKFEGSEWRNLGINNRKEPSFVVSVGFGKEELDWLTKLLKKAIEDCYKKETFTSCHSPRVLKAMGGKTLGRRFFQCKTILIKSVAEDGFRIGVLLLAGKWARAVICKCKEKVQDWTHEGKAIARMYGRERNGVYKSHFRFQGVFLCEFNKESRMVPRAGKTFSERKVCSSKKMVAKRKYDYSRKIQKGSGGGNEGGKGSCVAVGLDEEGLRGSIRDNECYNRKLLLRAHYRCSSTSLATKRENGWEGSSPRPAEENVLGPIEPETSFKAQSVRAQRGRRSRGLHAGPNAPQVHETVAASSPSLQQCWCFANKRGALWKQVISGKYGVEKVGWSSCGVRGAYGHKWRDDEALYVSFPYLVALIVSKEAQVVDVWDSTIEDGNWNPSFSKPLMIGRPFSKEYPLELMCSYLGFFRLERGMGKGLNFGSSAKEGLVSSKQDVSFATSKKRPLTIFYFPTLRLGCCGSCFLLSFKCLRSYPCRLK